MFGEPVCNFIRGLQHETVKAVPHLDAVALRELQIHCAGLQILGCAVRKNNHVILRGILKHQERRHKLGDGRRIILAVCIFLI